MGKSGFSQCSNAALGNQQEEKSKAEPPFVRSWLRQLLQAMAESAAWVPCYFAWKWQELEMDKRHARHLAVGGKAGMQVNEGGDRPRGVVTAVTPAAPGAATSAAK